MRIWSCSTVTRKPRRTSHHCKPFLYQSTWGTSTEDALSMFAPHWSNQSLEFLNTAVTTSYQLQSGHLCLSVTMTVVNNPERCHEMNTSDHRVSIQHAGLALLRGFHSPSVAESHKMWLNAKIVIFVFVQMKRKYSPACYQLISVGDWCSQKRFIYILFSTFWLM